MEFVLLLAAVATIFVVAVGGIYLKFKFNLITKIAALDMMNCSAAIIVTYLFTTHFGVTPVTAGVFTAVGISSTLLFGRFVGVLITRPLTQIREHATAVSGGDYDSVLKDQTFATRRDDIGVLARELYKMVVSLKASYEEVAKQQRAAAASADEAVRAREYSEQQRANLQDRIGNMLRQISLFADGDLTVRLEKEQDDELGQLSDAFNRAAEELGTVIHRIEEATSTVATSAAEMSASSDQLASSVQEQSSQSEEVAAAVEEMVRTIVENSRNAMRTAEIAGEAGKVAREGGEVVSLTLSKIREIAEVVRSSSRTVEKLGSSSQQIGEIVQVIDEIADQTNLLALNAAIEAARAGEQGRGFAVVADEVRKLAERTTTATKQIAGMIKTIQDETADAVQAMQEGDREVAEGLKLADQAGGALQRVVKGADNTVSMVTQIAAASEEQSTTSEQIARSVEMISSVSAESAEGISQIAKLTDNLNRVADELRARVSHFKVHSERSRVRNYNRYDHTRN